MSEDNKKEEHLFDEKELAELKQKDDAEDQLAKGLGILIGCLLLFIGYNVKSMYDTWTDDSVIFVQCPRKFHLDRPVILNRMDDISNVDFDNWIRSFSINFIMKLFPRSEQDVEKFFQYIVNHTSGYRKMRYEARLAKIENIKKSVDLGNYSKFYFEDTNEIKIRKVDNKNQWKVVANGFLHKRSVIEREKSEPRIELTIETIKPTMTNPEGLVVVDFEIIYVTDPISGNEVSL